MHWENTHRILARKYIYNLKNLCAPTHITCILKGKSGKTGGGVLINAVSRIINYV